MPHSKQGDGGVVVSLKSENSCTTQLKEAQDL